MQSPRRLARGSSTTQHAAAERFLVWHGVPAVVSAHARFYLDQTREDGQTQRWAVDGPPTNNLARLGIDQDFLKARDVIEVCGFLLKEEVASQRASLQSSSMPNVLSCRPMSGRLLVMPNGKRRSWSDYGVLEKCLLPGESKDTLREEAFGGR